jgi:uncharacterized membrane protein YfcA
MKEVLFIILGFAAGILSGLIGIGGGVIIVPLLVFMFGYSQHLAQGTALAALIPPIGLLATYVYYMNGDVNIKTAILIALGFFVGGFFGAKFAVTLDKSALEKIFGIALILIGLKMLLSGH